jgi:hypothetical protein
MLIVPPPRGEQLDVIDVSLNDINDGGAIPRGVGPEASHGLRKVLAGGGNNTG